MKEKNTVEIKKKRIVSKETRRKLSEASRGKHPSEETRRKISESSMGRTPWNKGIPMTEEQKTKLSIAKKGKFKGITYEERFGIEKSKDYKKKLSEAMKRRKEKYGYMTSPEASKKIGKTNSGSYESKYGKEKADKIKKKMSINNSGKGNPRYGVKLSKEFIEKRNKTIEENGTFKLENNPRWLGGISFEPYDKNFNIKFKRLIRKRDNQICMLCGIHREKLRRALDVHHIDYNKKMTIPQNCISLCQKCHIPTNINRTHWTNFFHSLLSEKYGYEYNNQEIIFELNNPNTIGSTCQI